MDTREPDGGTPGEGRRDGASQQLLVRVILMITFAAVFWLLCWALALTAIAQLVFRLLNGQPNADLARFGAALGRYARQIVEFLTFASERVPFPFAEWPAGAGGVGDIQPPGPAP